MSWLVWWRLRPKPKPTFAGSLAKELQGARERREWEQAVDLFGSKPAPEPPRWLNWLLRVTLCRLGLHWWEPVRFGGKVVPGKVCRVNGCRAWRSWWERKGL